MDEYVAKEVTGLKKDSDPQLLRGNCLDLWVLIFRALLGNRKEPKKIAGFRIHQ